MEWPRVRLDEIAEIVMGQSPPGETYNDEGDGLPFFQGKADFGDQYPTLRKWCSAPTRVAELGDLLLSVRAPVGPTNVAREKSCIGRGLAAIRVNPAYAEQDYLRFFFKYVEPMLSLQGQGSTFTAIKRNEVVGIEVPLPPFSEQRRIVEILDQADHLRRLRTEAEAKANRILPALFIKMFGDPATNPMGWPKRSISELATVITGNTPSRKKQEYFGDYIEWVKSDNLNTPSHYITPTSEYLSEEGAKVGRKALPGSALVTCIAGSPSAIGNVALADREVAFNQQINAAVPRKGVDCYYLYGHFVVGKRLVQAASTGGMKGIVTKNRFCEIEFLAPPSDLQERFGYRCKQVCEQTEARLKQAGRFDRLFSFLLHRAFSGDLTASWREACMEELLQEMEQQATTLKKRNYRGIRQ